MKIGDKAVCVDESPCRRCAFPVNLKKGTVYVVMSREPVTGGVIVTLAGNKPYQCHESIYGELGYGADRFRLLDELRREATLRTVVNNDIEIRKL